MKFQKKGLSPVIATLAIVLLTLAAAGLIAGVVVPLVKNQLNNAGKCIGYENYFTFYEEFDYNCYINYSSNWTYGLSVKAGTLNKEKTEQVEGFILQFTNSGESIAVTVKNGSDATPEIRMLKTSKFLLEIPTRGEVQTYVYTGASNFDSVAIFPLLRAGKVCDEADKINLAGEICALSINLTVA